MLKVLASLTTVAATIALLTLAPSAQAASDPAAATAEAFVTDNIHNGLAILNDKKLSTDERRAQFAAFLLRTTDMKRIALFTLGQYRGSARPAELDSFVSAFQDYAIAVYQSYFGKYAGQTLTVTGSVVNAPNDFTVSTNLVGSDGHDIQQPVEVDFRVLIDSGKPLVMDVTFAGISLAQMERDQNVSILGNSNGSFQTLISDLGALANGFRRNSE